MEFSSLSCFVSLFTLFMLTIGDESCDERTPCSDDGICNPNTDECVNTNSTYNCGKYGVFLECGSGGVVVGECGSGGHADCTKFSENLCPDDKDIFEGIDCNYPGLIPKSNSSNGGNNGFDNTTDWICGKYGTKLTCEHYDGSVLVGVCGAGRNEDCKKYCKGWHAIQCASSNYFSIDWDSCKWVEGSKGEWIYCEDDQIAAGHCGSGFENNCGLGVSHSIQCCKFNYD